MNARSALARLKRLEAAISPPDSVHGVVTVPFSALQDGKTDLDQLITQTVTDGRPEGVIAVPEQIPADEWAKLASAYCADLLKRVETEFKDV